MIFQHTWENVLSGAKTQTRRIVKPNERQYREPINGDMRIVCVKRGDGTGWVDSSDPIVYAVYGWLDNHKTYAVQPGRTKPAIWWRNIGGEIQSTAHPDCPASVRGWSNYMLNANGFWQARIRITDIRCENVRNISNEDAHAEGFSDPAAFLATWIFMHDKPMRRKIHHLITPDMQVNPLYLNSRPDSRYLAWALTFELVKDG